MPEWKALNVGVESKDVAQDQNPEFVRVNSMFNVFEVFIPANSHALGVSLTPAG